MSWDDSDEATWERWERVHLGMHLGRTFWGAVVEYLREAGAREAGGGVVDGETEPASSHGGEQPASTSKDPESLNPVYGLYDRLPHEEE